MNDMKFKNKFVEKIYKSNVMLGKAESVLSVILLWTLIVVCMIFISCRFIFHVSTPWADELSRYLLIILAWFGGSYAASVGDHLEIDIVSTVVKKFSKNSEKVLDVIDRIGQVIVFFVMIFFTYYLFLYIQKIDKMGTISNTMGFKMTIPMYFVFAGCILILLHTIFNIVLPRQYWFGGKITKGGSEQAKEEGDE